MKNNGQDNQSHEIADVDDDDFSDEADSTQEELEEEAEPFGVNSLGLPYEVYRWLREPSQESKLETQARSHLQEELLDAFESLPQARDWLMQRAREMLVIDKQVVLVIKYFDNGKLLFKLEAFSL